MSDEEVKKLKEYFKTSERVDDKELNKLVIKCFPWLEPRNNFSGKRITECMGLDGEEGFWPGEPEKHPIYDYEFTELFHVPAGWRKVFGFDFCMDIQRIYDTLSKEQREELYPEDIKEKYGRLTVYFSIHPKGLSESLRKYEALSLKTCINCGKPAKFFTTGWIMPVCKDCAKGMGPVSLIQT